MINNLTDLKNIKNEFIRRENLYFIIIVILVFFLDRYSKLTIIQNYSDNIYFINNFLNFDLNWNIGIGFGLLSTESSFIYNTITTLILLVIIFCINIALKSEILDKICFSMIVGGALGNFYDRIYFKAVPDFIDFHIGNFHWFVFNFADIFITLGIFIYILKGTLQKK